MDKVANAYVVMPSAKGNQKIVRFTSNGETVPIHQDLYFFIKLEVWDELGRPLQLKVTLEKVK